MGEGDTIGQAVQTTVPVFSVEETKQKRRFNYGRKRRLLSRDSDGAPARAPLQHASYAFPWVHWGSAGAATVSTTQQRAPGKGCPLPVCSDVCLATGQHAALWILWMRDGAVARERSRGCGLAARARTICCGPWPINRDRAIGSGSPAPTCRASPDALREGPLGGRQSLFAAKLGDAVRPQSCQQPHQGMR